MNRNKRQRNTLTDNENKKKLQCISTCLTTTTTDNIYRNAITYFEDLSNELIYEIFEFLDAYQLYKIFFDLNMRFRNICIYSNFPLTINILSSSKSSFQRFYTQFIMYNKHRINSIYLSDPFIIEYFSSSIENISNYSQLQTLILDKIESQFSENLLNNLLSLSNLSSLAIHINYDSNKENINKLIFQLPSLKYCKISLEENLYFYLSPISTNKTSPIEHLIINAKCDYTIIDAILSYVPKLRRLSINYINVHYQHGMRILPTVLNNLTHVSLTFERFTSNLFEQFVKQYFGQVKVMYISLNGNMECLNATLWERLILSYMPYLRIFDLQYVYPTRHNNRYQITYEDIFKDFTSKFWSERQWFFAYDHSSEKSSSGMFYSIQPYRRKYFTLMDESELNSNRCYKKTILDSVHHVIIQDERIISNCSKYFPNANELTISDQRTDRSKRLAIDNTINNIIPLVQLTKLNIDYNYRPFSKVIDLLYDTPNVHTLVFKHLSLIPTDYYPLQKSNKFQLVSNENKIKKITILFDYTLDDIKLIINLCPKLQQISIGNSNIHLEPTIRFLLTETNQSTCHLSLICIFVADFYFIDKIKLLIESEKLLNDYSIKFFNRLYFIWW